MYINLKLRECLSCSYSSNTLPIPLKAHQMAYSESLNSAYIFGGLTENNARSNAVYKWDTSQSNGWFTEITAITPSTNFFSHDINVVVINNYLYFIGLFDSAIATDWGSIYVFDMNTDSFIDNTNLLKSPFGSYGGCLATNNTHIFMVGGRLSGNDFLNQLQIYSVAENTWYTEEITIAPINAGWGYQNCEMVNNKLYVFGGIVAEPSNGQTNEYYKYEWETKWTKLGTKSVATLHGTSSYYPEDGNIYRIGGSIGGADETNVIDIFGVSTEMITDTSFMLESFYGLSSLIINDQLFIFGGWNGVYEPNGISDVVQVCDFDATPAPTYPNLGIRNCDGAGQNNYKAEVLNVPNALSLEYVKMRDESGNNEWLLGTYNENTACYEWENGILPYQLPLDFKIKANDMKIKTMDVINSWDSGFEGAMKDNFAAETQNELKTDPLIRSQSNYNNKSSLFIPSLSSILIIGSIFFVVISMIIICCCKKRREKKANENTNNSDSTTTVTNKSKMENPEIVDNKVDKNEINIQISCDTQTNSAIVDDEAH